MSKLMPIDPQTGERTRVRRQILDNGSKVRVAVKSGEQIPNSE
jgi:large subunit ribosomal protein L24